MTGWVRRAVTGTTAITAALLMVATGGTALAARGHTGSGRAAVRGRLVSVSCPAQGFCLAVGVRRAAPGHPGGFALELRRGRWREIATPGLDPRSVSCASARMCVAISGVSAARWNGRAWRRTRVIPRGTSAEFLAAVACPGTRDCIAVGGQGTPGNGDAFGEIWNGRAWQVNNPANQCATEGAGTSCGEFTISCLSTTFCMSAGAQQPAEDDYTGDGNLWTGSGWINEDNPPPSGSVTSLSCPSASFCLGVGTTWTGGTGWTDVGAPAGLTSVACPGTTDCLGVSTGGGGQIWNGTSWSALTVPAPHGPASMRAIACSSPDACVAVGVYTTTAGHDRALADTWNGTAWSQSTLPRSR